MLLDIPPNILIFFRPTNSSVLLKLWASPERLGCVCGYFPNNVSWLSCVLNKQELFSHNTQDDHTHSHTHARTYARKHACTHTGTHARTHAHTLWLKVTEWIRADLSLWLNSASSTTERKHGYSTFSIVFVINGRMGRNGRDLAPKCSQLRSVLDILCVLLRLTYFVGYQSFVSY